MITKLTDKQRKILKISDAILDIIDHSEDFTRSDLQGVVEALAMQIVNGEGLYSNEKATRL